LRRYKTDGWTGLNFRHLIAFMITTALWQWFQCTLVPESLRKEILDYLQDRGDYEGFSEWLRVNGMLPKI
jgi:hypothetical protein